jgi:glutathione S-transferase
MWKFYYAPISCSLAAHIALEQAGATYEAERVDFTKNAQREPAYLGVNPKGRVPALVTGHGVLTETLAILAFVAQSFPEARLAPLDDPWAFARMQSFNSYLASTVHVAHAHRMRGRRWVDDDDAIVKMQEKVTQNMNECFDLIERDQLRGPWVLGEQYSVSDPYLFTISRWLESDGVDPSRFPKVLAHRERMAELPAVRKVLAEVENWG